MARVLWTKTTHFCCLLVVTAAVVVATQPPQGHCELQRSLRGTLTLYYGSSLSVRCDCFGHYSLSHGLVKLSHPPTIRHNNETWPRKNDRTASISPRTWRTYVPTIHSAIVLSDSKVDSKDEGVYCCSAPNATSDCLTVVIKHTILLRVSVAFSTRDRTVQAYACCSVETDDDYVRNNSVFLMYVNGAPSTANTNTDDNETNHTIGQNLVRRYHRTQCFLHQIKRRQNCTCILQQPYNKHGERVKVWKTYQPDLVTSSGYPTVTSTVNAIYTAEASRSPPATFTTLDSSVTTATEATLTGQMTPEDRSDSEGGSISFVVWLSIGVALVVFLIIAVLSAMVWWKCHRVQQTANIAGAVKEPVTLNDFEHRSSISELRAAKRHTDMQEHLDDIHKDILAIKNKEERDMVQGVEDRKK